MAALQPANTSKCSANGWQRLYNSVGFSAGLTGAVLVSRSLRAMLQPCKPCCSPASSLALVSRPNNNRLRARRVEGSSWVFYSIV